MIHLVWHKKRLIILKPNIEGLSDYHRFLFELSRSFDSVGNQAERKQLLTQTLKLWRGWGNDYEVARILGHLSDASRLMDLPKEGVQLAQEALEIYERLGDTKEQVLCLIKLGWLLESDKQLDAAEEAISRAISLLPETGQQYHVCESHRVLGEIYRSKGKTEEVIHHFEVALGIASSFDWHHDLFWIYYSLAGLFLDGGGFDDANAHIERAKLHTANRAYHLGRAMELQARVWYNQQT